MFYLLFHILNVPQSYAAGHCCACWRPSLGSTCILLAGSASREDLNFSAEKREQRRTLRSAAQHLLVVPVPADGQRYPPKLQHAPNLSAI